MKWKTAVSNFISHWPQLVSVCAVACMGMGSVKTMAVTALAIAGMAVLVFWKKPKGTWADAVLSLLWMVLTIGCGFLFYHRMQYHGLILILSEGLGLDPRDLAFDFAFVGILGAMTAVIYRWIPGVSRREPVNAAGQIPTRRVLLASFVTALVFLGICSKSSPLYPFNDWVDANCFLTVGKGMLHGMVPYRDLYEQKGPLLYMLHAAAALISGTSFFGVFILEVLAATAFLFQSFRIMTLFRKDLSLLWLPVVAAVVYSAKAFSHGDSAEELCLPFMAYGLYCGVKAITEKRLPNRKEAVILGITSGCVLWIKYSQLGFYLGWFAAFFLAALWRRDLLGLIKMLGGIVLGVVLVSIPVLAYFAIHGAMEDLWTAYFYNNLFLYSSASEGNPRLLTFLNLLGGMQHLLSTNRIVMVCLLLALISMVKCRRYPEALLTLLSWLGLFGMVYVGGRRYLYYSMIFGVFMPLAIPGFWGIQTFLSQKAGGRPVWKGIAAGACLLAAFLMSSNTYLLSYDKEDMPQYQFAAIINGKPDATLLDYGLLDAGFYTVADVLPNRRFFCWLNIPLEEMFQERQRYLDEGAADFVVTRNYPLNSDNYELRAESSFFFEGEDHVYMLYQLKETE